MQRSANNRPSPSVQFDRHSHTFARQTIFSFHQSDHTRRTSVCTFHLQWQSDQDKLSGPICERLVMNWINGMPFLISAR